MIRTVFLQDTTMTYTLLRKKVKNINIRVTEAGVFVSAPQKTPLAFIENTIAQKQEWIEKAIASQLKKAKETRDAAIYSDAACLFCFETIKKELSPLFSHITTQDIPIIVKDLKSCWGVCHIKNKTITLNKRLMEKPKEAIAYVILHEYVHFLHPNHQKAFHNEMKRLMPDYKKRCSLLK